VNLCLFQPEETERPLPLTDPRAEHVLAVLRRRVGDSFDVGLANGPRGKATLVARTETHLNLRFAWGEVPPPPPDLRLWIGLPRPQTARKILNEATSIGVRCIHFFATEKGEASYGSSTLWSSGEWQRHVTAGAEQAFSTHLPEVTWGRPLTALVEELPLAGSRIALDVYEAQARLGTLQLEAPTTLAVGPERGWSAAERDLLRNAGFTLASLGDRVLRVETAVVYAMGVMERR
jgi:16S rRNA (uracil1498-N3)-methyltransferase